MILMEHWDTNRIETLANSNPQLLCHVRAFCVLSVEKPGAKGYQVTFQRLIPALHNLVYLTGFFSQWVAPASPEQTASQIEVFKSVMGLGRLRHLDLNMHLCLVLRDENFRSVTSYPALNSITHLRMQWATAGQETLDCLTALTHISLPNQSIIMPASFYFHLIQAILGVPRIQLLVVEGAIHSDCQLSHPKLVALPDTTWRIARH
ncbi:hypothetical protein DL96DRAFT_1681740, partial [Flagelloscypha sp. PMI_526]